MYVELKTGFNDDGPAWIGRVLGQRGAAIAVPSRCHNELRA